MDPASGTTTTYMRPETRRKFAKLAELDARTLVAEYDVVANEELRRRGLDPETLRPVETPKTEQVA